VIAFQVSTPSKMSGRYRQEKTFYISNTVFTLDPTYSDLKMLGKGSYGVVVSAFSERLNKKIAIKKVTPVAKHVQDAKHVLREVRLLRYLGRHENIISLEDLIFRDQSDELYIVMELMDSDLHHIIQSKQPLTEQHFQHFMYQLFSGLKYLHDNRIIHRDLKPGNLLVTRDCKLRITDFGLARERPMGKGDDPDESVDVAMTEHVVTRWYRPPELMLCPDGLYTYAVDIWSCGCIFAELLGRNPLFPGKNFVHQLSLVFDIIGSPRDNEVTHITNYEARKFLSSQAKKPKVPFHKIFPDVSSACWDLLDSLLTFDPNQRISVDEALKSSFLYNYFIPECQVFPPMPKEFEFSFERQSAMTRFQLKQLITNEVISFKREKNPNAVPAPATNNNSSGHPQPSQQQTTTPQQPAAAPPQPQQQPPQPTGRSSNKPPVPQRSESTRRATMGTESQQKLQQYHQQQQQHEDNETMNDHQKRNTNIASYAKNTATSSNRSHSAPKMRPSSSSSNIPKFTRETSNLSQTSANNNEQGEKESKSHPTRPGVPLPPKQSEPLTTNNNNIDKLLSYVSKPEDALFSPKPKVLQSALAHHGSNQKKEPENDLNHSMNNSMNNNSSNRKSMSRVDPSRLSLDDENIVSKYEKYSSSGLPNQRQPGDQETQEKLLKSQELDRLSHLLPPQRPKSPKTIRVVQPQPDESIVPNPPSVSSTAATVVPSYPHHQKKQNNNNNDLISFLDNPNATRKSLTQLRQSQSEIARKQREDESKDSRDDNDNDSNSYYSRRSEEKTARNEKDTTNYSSISSPSRLNNRKTIMETYTSPKRLRASNNNNPVLNSPGREQRSGKKEFPPLESPARNINLDKINKFPLPVDNKSNDEEDEEEDLRTLRAQRKSLQSSKDGSSSRTAFHEEKNNSTTINNDHHSSLLQNNVFRASWKNLRQPPPEEIPTTKPVVANTTTIPVRHPQSRSHHNTTGQSGSHDDHHSVYSTQKLPLAATTTRHHETTAPQERKQFSSTSSIPVHHHPSHIPVPQQQHHKPLPPQQDPSAGDKKKKITVPKSPKFSTMSWQKRHQDFTEALHEQQQAGGKNPTAEKKRSVSVGKTRY
jgi:serine/threonine protein kinase